MYVHMSNYFCVNIFLNFCHLTYLQFRIQYGRISRNVQATFWEIIALQRNIFGQRIFLRMV
jgi:hypothetical protein